MLTDNNGQIKLYDDVLENMVRKDHPYRKILESVDFKTLLLPFHGIYAENGRPSDYSIETMFKCIFLQFSEDLSFRQLQQYLEENVAAKLFCGFSLMEKIPHYTLFSKFQIKLGKENIEKIHNSIVESLRKKNIISDTFTFIDTTAIVSKMALWEERDKAIEDGLEKLNNQNVSNYSADKDGKFGAKGKKKFWFGHKTGISTDMKEGMITKIVTDSANTNDWDMFEDLKPSQGAVLADKIFDTNEIQEICKQHELHSMILKKNNRKDKNRDLDRFLTKLRSPFEGIFTHFKKKKNDGGYTRTHFRGKERVGFQMIMKAIGSNLRRLVEIIDDYKEKYGEAYYGCIVS